MGEPSATEAPYQRDAGRFLRVLGAMIVGLGVVLTAIGSISLFSSWNAVGGSRYYWAAFLGLPLIAIGSALTESHNLTAFQRNHAGELTPVADGLANKTGDAKPPEANIDCQRCHAVNPGTAKFCHQCGTALMSSKCPDCGAVVTPNAKFCNQCGKPLELVSNSD